MAILICQRKYYVQNSLNAAKSYVSVSLITRATNESWTYILYTYINYLSSIPTFTTWLIYCLIWTAQCSSHTTWSVLIISLHFPHHTTIRLIHGHRSCYWICLLLCCGSTLLMSYIDTAFKALFWHRQVFLFICFGHMTMLCTHTLTATVICPCNNTV